MSKIWYSRHKYTPILAFQFFIVVLFFIFVRYDGSEEADNRGFMDVQVMIFVGFGFLMTFMKKYSYSSVGINFFLAALAIQWAIFCQQFFGMIVQNKWVVHVNLKVLVEADIMAATVLISMGALLGYTSPLQLLSITIVEVFMGCLNLFLINSVFKAADIGGSIGIHTFGAYFGLGVSAALRSNCLGLPKPPVQDAIEHKNAPTYTSDVTAMIGTLFLWIYWPSFNATLAVSDSEYQRAIVNTYLSLAAATVTTFVLSVMLSENPGKWDMVHIQNSTLAGGVAVGSVSNMFISPGGALCVGIGAGILSVFGFLFLTPQLNKRGFKDSCGVNNLHGMPGIYSGLLSVLFAAIASADDYGLELTAIFPAMAPQNEGRSALQQALYQLIALAVTILIGAVCGSVTGMMCNLCPLKYIYYYEDNANWEMPHDYIVSPSPTIEQATVTERRSVAAAPVH